MSRNVIRDALLGVAVGDALGVPVEFKSREVLKKNPVTDMQGYGTHNQPPGTWSDDSSLTFCLAEMLCSGYDLQNLANRCINWREHAYWTPHGYVFDIGITTSQAISWMLAGTPPTLAGMPDEMSNGNGSLMRILPLAFYVRDFPITQRFDCVKAVSSLTHAHIRSVLSCFIYIEMALQLMQGKTKHEAYQDTQQLVNSFLDEQAVASQGEIDRFSRLLHTSIHEYEEAAISSSGYVLHSLEASFWCLLNSDSYETTVLKAVNLGSDTDTTAAIAGGLAGLLYGYEQIPEKWLSLLARKDDIEELADRLYQTLM